jgi:hypothetical protein
MAADRSQPVDFIVTSLIALGLAWVAVNILVGVAMFFFGIICQFYRSDGAVHHACADCEHGH